MQRFLFCENYVKVKQVRNYSSNVANEVHSYNKYFYEYSDFHDSC